MPISSITPTALPTDDQLTQAPDGREQPETAAAPAEHLPPNQVRISGDRLVTLRPASIADEEQVLKLLAELGHTPGQLATATLMRSNALWTIKAINGREDGLPRNADQFRVFQALFTPTDGLKLALAYIRTNGLGDETFQNAG